MITTVLRAQIGHNILDRGLQLARAHAISHSRSAPIAIVTHAALVQHWKRLVARADAYAVVYAAEQWLRLHCGIRHGLTVVDELYPVTLRKVVEVAKNSADEFWFLNPAEHIDIQFSAAPAAIPPALGNGIGAQA